MLHRLLLIALGGALGTLARYGTAHALLPASERSGLPLGTLCVNIVGCFVIGLLQGLFLDRWILREEYRLALIVGFLGGYTTFSAFGWDSYRLLAERQFARFALYVMASNAIGIAAVVLGYSTARQRT